MNFKEFLKESINLKNISFEEYKKMKNEQKQKVDELSKKLNSYPKNNMGMTDEKIRITQEYKELKRQYDIEFKKEQEINQAGAKLFKNELRKDHLDKRAKWKNVNNL